MNPSAAQIANRTTMQGRFLAHVREATQLNMQAALVGETNGSQVRFKAVKQVLSHEFGVEI